MILSYALGLLVVSALLSLHLCVFLWSQARESRSARLMGWLMLASTIWALFGALELLAPDQTTTWMLANVQYLAIAMIPVLWYRFGTRLFRRDDHTKIRLRDWDNLLWVVPLVTLALVWTDPWWGLVRTDFRWEQHQGFSLLVKEFGPWFWVHSAYSYVLVVIGTVRAVQAMVRPSAHGPAQAWVFAGAALFPSLANIAYLAALWPFPEVDPTPLAFTATGLLFVLTLSRFRFLALLPVAQDALVAGLEQAILIVDKKGRLAFLNPAATRAFGPSRWDAGQTLEALRTTYPSLGALPDPQQAAPGSVTVEIVVNAPEGDRRFEVQIRLVEHHGSEVGVVYIGHDVTQRARAQKEMEKQLFYFSLHDPLTGLPNRALVLNRLDQALMRFQREPTQPFALLLIDFDSFKLVNDSYGHSSGDTFLRESATRILGAIRSIDTVSRLGADQFVVLLDRVAQAGEAVEVADRIADDLSVPIRMGEDTIVPSASIGILVATPGYNNPEELLRDVDLAMYQAKAEGRNRRAAFVPSMRTTVQERTRLTHDLNRAIMHGQIEVHYQPIVRLSDEVVVGCEALARWTHPQLGRIGPDRFIPMAEKSGLIVPLGLSVLMEACKTAAILAKEYPQRKLFIAVNVSAHQLTQAGFAEVLVTSLERHQLSPDRIHLELTESALVQGAEEIKTLLQELVDRGFRFKLDDFGTGYSSLSYLHRFPIQTIKIDKSFVQDLGPSGGILKGIVSLGHELGKDIVAEGIETQEQAKNLRGWGCDYGQGYLFGKPMDRESWLRFLNNTH